MGGDALIVLDTHALYWLDQDEPALGPRAREACGDASETLDLCVSAMTFWEIAMLVRKNRLDVGRPVPMWRGDLLAKGLAEIPLNGDVAVEAAMLPGFHDDPADRIIVATAVHYGATLLTADRKILGWDGAVERQDARL